MEMFNFDYDEVVELGSRSRGTTGKKRKWREIEALKDKHRLQKELQSIDIAYEGLIPIGLNIRSVLSNLGYKVTSPAPHRQ